MAALVVLPGLDGTGTLHTAFIDAVAPAFDSVSVVSYPPNVPLGYTELEAHARASLPPTRFFLLGESFSGPIALRIAADPPPHLQGLVLSTTFARSPMAILSSLASLSRIAPVKAMPMSLLSWWLFGRWSTPLLQDALREALRAVRVDVLRRRVADALRVDVTSHLADIRVPVLDLRATEDRLLSRGAEGPIRQAIPDCHTAEVVGPHLLLQANPVECARHVAAFARGIHAPLTTRPGAVR